MTEDITLIDLTRKLAMLMTMITVEQQTIHSIKVSDMQILDKKVYIPIMSVISKTKASKQMEPLSFVVYYKEPKLCLVRLTEYLKRTQDFRKTNNLF